MTKKEKAVTWAIQTALDESHGYSQNDRWGPDYDCSSFVITAFEQAGIPLKSAGATFTGDLQEAAEKTSFRKVPVSEKQRGDILLRHSGGSDGHTAIYLGNDMLVHAAGTYGHPERGDRSGNEISIQPYYDAGWQTCLRYPEEQREEVETVSIQLPVLAFGMEGPAVSALQILLEGYGFSVGKCGVDGELGPDTMKALLLYQKTAAAGEAGTTGEKTWESLLGGIHHE